MIVKRKLPHGNVPVVGIKEQASRDAFMRLNENIAVLADQLSELQGAFQGLERDFRSAMTRIAALETA